MPKDESQHASWSHKARDNSYKPYTNHGKRPSDSHGNSFADDNWEDVRCPICMETPHNAVLLRCSSHHKGCRPYMCDSSYRHSNCLDQYCKAQIAAEKAKQDVAAAEAAPVSSSGEGGPELSLVLSDGGCKVQESSGESSQMETALLRGGDLLGLICPLCRGQVKGWEVVKAARLCLNKKARICAQEACSFVGSYEELRSHARQDHPAARPTEIDACRQRDWTRLEWQRDLGDVLSTIRSGASLMEDYLLDHDSFDSDISSDEGHLLTVFLLFQMFGPASSFLGGRLFPALRAARTYRRTASTRQGLWGEILQQSLNSEGNVSPDDSSTREPVMRSSSLRHQRNQHRF